MADAPTPPKKEQIKRAQRLHQQIERLKQGQPVSRGPKAPGKGGSLREQIETRVAGQKKPTTREH
jgi:hypothetical protein